TEADQRRVARDVLARGLSVRETEGIVRSLAKPADAAPGRQAKPKDVHTRAAEEQLRLALGTPISIKRRGKGGVVQIAFGNENELQRIYEYLTETRR
ncbi:MAG: ParB/RepB/Spo0J family partition protein, partial [Vicinamibacterales bacterium]